LSGLFSENEDVEEPVAGLVGELARIAGAEAAGVAAAGAGEADGGAALAGFGAGRAALAKPALACTAGLLGGAGAEVTGLVGIAMKHPLSNVTLFDNVRASD
jgi:hypothetical protein